MKTGVIIVFKSRIKDIPKDQLVALFNNAPKIEFCLLHKLNDETINDYLIGIAEQCENVSFVSIRNNKMNVSSVRAGSRFMHNEFNLKFLGYVIESKRIDLIQVIETFIENSEEIALRHNKNTRNKKNKQTFIQRLLSLPEFLNEPNEMANDPALI
ncbi:MAG: hypothetical protein CMB99_08090 [Flavobacteriaceae bacterium]|nr:hypothetical protein [Flavobacteriaceae bacterium]|tara:strand:- start:134534 stop:135001 length:468 start_codon:yes stop_codon:yes gene_type:complete